MEAPIPETFHLSASRLIRELEGMRTPEVIIRCLLRAYDRIHAAAPDMPGDEIVLRAEDMARGLLNVGLEVRRLAS